MLGDGQRQRRLAYPRRPYQRQQSPLMAAQPIAKLVDEFIATNEGNGERGQVMCGCSVDG